MLEHADWEAIAHVIGWAMCAILLGFHLDRTNTGETTTNKKVKTQ